MEFKKVTISIPSRMYKEAMLLVKKGLFSNFSDIVRTGIREELKELESMSEHMDDRLIYEDQELIKGVKKSLKDVKQKKFKQFKNEKEVDKFIDSI